MVRELLGKVLERAGFHVMLSTNGEEALATVFSYDGNIELVIADIVMPRMSGRELVARLRILRPETKALYMSGYAKTTIARHGLGDPEVPLLEKPFTPDAVLTAVRTVLAAPGRAI
jgi:DNA-binding NtrC family response regulator